MNGSPLVWERLYSLSDRSLIISSCFSWPRRPFSSNNVLSNLLHTAWVAAAFALLYAKRYSLCYISCRPHLVQSVFQINTMCIILFSSSTICYVNAACQAYYLPSPLQESITSILLPTCLWKYLQKHVAVRVTFTRISIGVCMSLSSIINVQTAKAKATKFDRYNRHNMAPS